MSSKISPGSAGLLIFMMCVCISILIVSKSYMPMKENLKLAASCTATIDAKVIKTKQEKEGIYYYGPEVEYYCTSMGGNIRADIVSTVKFDEKKFKKDEYVSVMYDPSDLSLVMMREDDTADSVFRRNMLLAAGIFSAGLAILIAAILTQYLRTRPKIFDSAPDGSSFEEWQKKQLDKEQTEKTEHTEQKDQEGKEDGSEKA